MPLVCDIPVEEPNTIDMVLDLLAVKKAAMAASDFCRAGAVLGHRAQVVRVSLTRLLAAGKIYRTARGLYELHGTTLSLTDALDTWSLETAGEVAWQGAWVAVHDTRVARSDKTAWRRHHLALSLRGFAEHAPGLHVHPANRPGAVDDERRRLEALGLAKNASVFLLSGWDAEDAQRARHLWPVRALCERYRLLERAMRQHLKGIGRLPAEVALRETMLLGRTAVMVLLKDPMLPQELMNPRPRATFVSQLQAYKAFGTAYWNDWLSTNDQRRQIFPETSSVEKYGNIS